MNTTITIANILTTNSPLLNLSAAQTAVVILLACVGAFYAGKLTGRLTKRVFAL